jgi:hypothetical protein
MSRVLTAVIILIVSIFARGGCLPDPGIDVPVGFGGGITQTQFNAVVDQVSSHFAPIVARHGGRLVAKRFWNDSTVNAYADRQGGTWNISFFGGLARWPSMTTLGFSMVVCHELGHHLGGAPLYGGMGWAAVEGEADYFSSRCMKELGFSQAEIQAGSLALGRSLASMGQERQPSPQTPDRTAVYRTVESHPHAQCRLDTYLNSLACPSTGEFSHSDPRVNSCYQYSSTSYGAGSRPRCWFAPR